MGEQAKGAPGVWSAEYERAQRDLRARSDAEALHARMRAEASAKSTRGCLIAFGIMMALGLGTMAATAIGSAISGAAQDPPTKAVPKPAAKPRR